MNKIRVLVVDDSAYMRHIISTLLSSDNEIEVINTAVDGMDAIEKIKSLKPDVVTLDIDMPKMDGITALRKIMEDTPLPVIMFSAFTKEGAETTIQALEIGAVDFVYKKGGPISFSIEKSKQELINKIKMAKNVDVSKLRFRSLKSKIKDRKLKDNNFQKVVAIASSTGGPAALYKIIPEIPSNLPCAFLIVQHMPKDFTKALSLKLNKVSDIEVKEAEEGDELKVAKALIAPGDYHMRIGRRGTISLSKEPRLHGVRPAADITFESVAEIFGKRTIAVVLTGMGIDGAYGSELIKKKGGYVISQDEKTSVVYSMPKEVADRKIADSILPLEEIPRKIIEVVKGEG